MPEATLFGSLCLGRARARMGRRGSWGHLRPFSRRWGDFGES